MKRIHPPPRELSATFFACCNERSRQLLIDLLNIKPPVVIEESPEELERMMKETPHSPRKVD